VKAFVFIYVLELVSVCRMDDVCMMTITLLMIMMMAMMMMMMHFFISHEQVEYWSLPGGSVSYKTCNKRQNK
jgi:hypothetical protein